MRRPCRFSSLIVAGLVSLPVHSHSAERTPDEVCQRLSHVSQNECLAAAALLLRAQVDAGIDLTIRVEAAEGGLTYAYENAPAGGRDCTSTKVLVLPANKTVRLLMTSTDVVYSWRVPVLAIDSDLVPGRVNEVIIEPITSPVMPEGRLIDAGKGIETATAIRIVADAYLTDGKLKAELFCKG